MPKALTLVILAVGILLSALLIFVCWGFGYTSSGLEGHASQNAIIEVDRSANLAFMLFCGLQVMLALACIKQLPPLRNPLVAFLRFLCLAALLGILGTLLAFVMLAAADVTAVRYIVGAVGDAVARLAGAW